MITSLVGWLVGWSYRSFNVWFRCVELHTSQKVYIWFDVGVTSIPLPSICLFTSGVLWCWLLFTKKIVTLFFISWLVSLTNLIGLLLLFRDFSLRCWKALIHFEHTHTHTHTYEPTLFVHSLNFEFISHSWILLFNGYITSSIEWGNLVVYCHQNRGYAMPIKWWRQEEWMNEWMKVK